MNLFCSFLSFLLLRFLLKDFELDIGYGKDAREDCEGFFKNSEFKCRLVHFVPPTIWAYGKSRIKKWKNLHDELICLYKIEEKIFKDHVTKCTYLGNPIIEKFLITEKKNKSKNSDIVNSKKITFMAGC